MVYPGFNHILTIILVWALGKSGLWASFGARDQSCGCVTSVSDRVTKESRFPWCTLRSRPVQTTVDM